MARGSAVHSCSIARLAAAGLRRRRPCTEQTTQNDGIPPTRNSFPNVMFATTWKDFRNIFVVLQPSPSDFRRREARRFRLHSLQSSQKTTADSISPVLLRKQNCTQRNTPLPSRNSVGGRMARETRAGGVSPPWFHYRGGTDVRRHTGDSLANNRGVAPTSALPVHHGGLTRAVPDFARSRACVRFASSPACAVSPHGGLTPLLCMCVCTS